MIGNIACFVPGCRNPVIGQCVGYKESCGHFYCVMHSAGKRCAECALQLENDEMAKRLNEEYTQLSKELHKEVTDDAKLIGCGYLIVWIAISLAIVTTPGGGTSSLLGFVLIGGYVLCLIIGLVLRIHTKRLEKARLARSMLKDQDSLSSTGIGKKRKLKKQTV
jgi:hypothetical protein